MRKQIEQVREFHQANNIPCQFEPGVRPVRVGLRQRILEEEVRELREASERGDIVGTSDGIVDYLYVLLGTALEFGLAHKLEEMFDEVHRSNMSKLGADGKPVRREDGKVLKGPNYSPPDLKSIIDAD